jgi:hypothetical protein
LIFEGVRCARQLADFIFSLRRRNFDVEIAACQFHHGPGHEAQRTANGADKHQTDADAEESRGANRAPYPVARRFKDCGAVIAGVVGAHNLEG